jgi:hypothetical protein
MNDVKAATGYRKRAMERPAIGARAARTLPRVSAESPPGGYIFGAKSVSSSHVHCFCADWCVYDLNSSLVSLV